MEAVRVHRDELAYPHNSRPKPGGLRFFVCLLRSSGSDVKMPQTSHRLGTGMIRGTVMIYQGSRFLARSSVARPLTFRGNNTVFQDMLSDDFGRERSRFLPQMAVLFG
jgi:hypothetical protein